MSTLKRPDIHTASDEQLRIWAAKAVGWKWIEYDKNVEFWEDRDGARVQNISDLPNAPADLNDAVALAEPLKIHWMIAHFPTTGSYEAQVGLCNVIDLESPARALTRATLLALREKQTAYEAADKLLRDDGGDDIPSDEP